MEKIKKYRGFSFRLTALKDERVKVEYLNTDVNSWYFVGFATDKEEINIAMEMLVNLKRDGQWVDIGTI